MDLSLVIGDNIDDVLIKIIQFTHIRRKTILDNIANCRANGFVPQKIDVENFAQIIAAALAEHQKTGRLCFKDARTVRFSQQCQLDIQPQEDQRAKKLLEDDPSQYIHYQKQQLSENLSNNRLACAILKCKLEGAKR